MAGYETQSWTGGHSTVDTGLKTMGPLPPVSLSQTNRFRRLMKRAVAGRGTVPVNARVRGD